jgi:adenine-specific DNA-methyltransferase
MKVAEMESLYTISENYNTSERIVVYGGDCLDLFKKIPDNSIKLIITSPPYNIGKEYEKKLSIDHYIEQQSRVIAESVRVLSPSGSICWQVGNYVSNGSIIPLDIALYPVFVQLGLTLRNRIIWHFEHGLHCSKRFSGRYETVNWFTKSNDYTFNLDQIRVPQKYPGKKHFKGPRAGEYSGNPKGKNPGDVWDIPNVKSNHVEKTEHPCQFPVELIERFVLSLTNPDEWVLDPFLGTGTSIVAAIRHGRRGMGAETMQKYVDISKDRIRQEMNGTLRTRPMNRPIYDPAQSNNKLIISPWDSSDEPEQTGLFSKNRETRD